MKFVSFFVEIKMPVTVATVTGQQYERKKYLKYFVCGINTDYFGTLAIITRLFFTNILTVMTSNTTKKLPQDKNQIVAQESVDPV